MISQKNGYIKEFVQSINDVKDEIEYNKLLKYLVMLGINAYTNSGQPLTYLNIKRWTKTLQKKNKKNLQDQVSQLKQQIKNLTQNVENTLNGGKNWASTSNSIATPFLKQSQLKQQDEEVTGQGRDCQKYKKMNFDGLDIQEINRLFNENIEYRNNNKNTAKQQADNEGAAIKSEDNGPLHPTELNSILSPKNTLKKMSFQGQNKQSHSVHTTSTQNTQRRIPENLHLNSIHIQSNSYHNGGLDQINPLISCKNNDKSSLKLQDFQSPPSLENSEYGMLSSKSVNQKQQTSFGDKNQQKNKENIAYYGNQVSNNKITSQTEDKKRNSSISPQKSQNALFHSQNSNSQVTNKNSQKNENTSSALGNNRNNLHKKNLNMHKQPCQKISQNRSRSSNPSRSNSRTPRNSKSPLGTISFNGANSQNQVPSYLRNVQSKIKDQIEFHKELKKNEAKLIESHQSHAPSSEMNSQKQNQNFSQSQGISPSHNYSNSMSAMNNHQNYFKSQNNSTNTNGVASSLMNSQQDNKMLTMEHYSNHSRTLSTLQNNSSKNSNSAFGKALFSSNNQGFEQQSRSVLSQPNSNHQLINQTMSNLNTNQFSQGVASQSSCQQMSTLQQQQQETLFTGHFRTKSNISEYQTTIEDHHHHHHNHNAVDSNYLAHSTLKHNQIKNIYTRNNIQDTSQLPQSYYQAPSTHERNNLQNNTSPQRQRLISVLQPNSNPTQIHISPTNSAQQSYQGKFTVTREQGTPNAVEKRKSAGKIVSQINNPSNRNQIDNDDQFRKSLDNKKQTSFLNQDSAYPSQHQIQPHQQQINQSNKIQDQTNHQGKKNVLDIATSFLKSSIMQQLCNTKTSSIQQQQQQQQQPIIQNQVCLNSLMNINIKSQHQGDFSQKNQEQLSDNSKGFIKKQESQVNEINQQSGNNSLANSQLISQPQQSIQEQIQQQMNKASFPKKHPCDQTLSPQDLQLLMNQNPNISLASNYQSANFGNIKSYHSPQANMNQSQLSNINICVNYCSNGNNHIANNNNNIQNNNNNCVPFQAIPHQNGDQSMAASSLFSSFNPSNETKGFFQNDFEKRINDLGNKSSNSRRQQISQNDVSSNISFNAGDLSNNLIQPHVDNPFY